MSKKSIGSIFCRSVGPGGTDVMFYPTPEGIKCIWSNENCPYDFNGAIDADTYESEDGHNVSMITWLEMEEMMKHKPK